MYGEACLSKKKSTNELSKDFPQRNFTINVMETHWLSVKENIQGAAICIEDNADSLLGNGRTHRYLET